MSFMYCLANCGSVSRVTQIKTKTGDPFASAVQDGEPSSTEALGEASANSRKGTTDLGWGFLPRICVSRWAQSSTSHLHHRGSLALSIRPRLLASLDPVTHIALSLTPDFVSRSIFCFLWVRQYLLPPVVFLVSDIPVSQRIEQVYLDQILWCSRPPVHHSEREITGWVPNGPPDIYQLIPPPEQLIYLSLRYVPPNPCLCCLRCLVNMHLLHWLPR